MKRTDIINALIKKHGYTSYLEIGVQTGVHYSDVQCEDKTSVDPDHRWKAAFIMTSDKFFEQNNRKFDIIFIDGLHHAFQVERDIINALKVLNEGGTIVCHDMSPSTKYMQEIPIHAGEWTGDCWKAFVRLRKRNDLTMLVVDTDYGCGIIRPGEQEPLQVEEPLTYEGLDGNRLNWLNLTEPETWLTDLNNGAA